MENFDAIYQVTHEQLWQVQLLSSAHVPGQSHWLLSTKLLSIVHGVFESSTGGQRKGSTALPSPTQRGRSMRPVTISRQRKSGQTSLDAVDANEERWSCRNHVWNESMILISFGVTFWILNGGSKTFTSLPAVTSICFLWKGWQINTTRVTGVEGFVSTRHWAVTKVIIDEGIWNIALRLGTLKVRCPWDNLLIAQPYEFHLLTESFRQRQFPRAVVIGDRSWALCTARVRSVSNHLQRHS